MFFLKSIAIDQMPTGVGRTKTNVENTIDDSAINFCFIACSLLPADNSPLIFEQSLLICLSHIFGRFPISASYKPSRVLSVRLCHIVEQLSQLFRCSAIQKGFVDMVRFLPLSLLRNSISRMVALANRELKRSTFRQVLIEGYCARSQNIRSIAHHRALLESLEPRHLMAAVPIANNDAAFYTSISTDLVVSTSSSPAHLLANDLDIDGGSITTSVVTNPTSGSLVAFGTNGTFTYRPNTGFSGIDSFTYKVNDGSLDSNVAKVTIAIGTKLLAQQNLESNVGINSQITTGNLSLTEQLTPRSIARISRQFPRETHYHR